MPGSTPQPLTATISIQGFDCGKPVLNDWLQRYARMAQGSGSARTFVALDEAIQVAGYYSLTVGQVDVLEAPDRVRQGMGAYPIPVVLLARLAVDRRYQGQGIGAGLLQDVIRRAVLIAEQAGIRALLTHPLDEDARRFYLGYSFMPSPVREDQLLLLLKDARRFIRGTG